MRIHSCEDVIHKDMHNVGIAFEIPERNCHVPVGWKKATGHMVFEFKMDFMRKER